MTERGAGVKFRVNAASSQGVEQLPQQRFSNLHCFLRLTPNLFSTVARGEGLFNGVPDVYSTGPSLRALL